MRLPVQERAIYDKHSESSTLVAALCTRSQNKRAAAAKKFSREKVAASGRIIDISQSTAPVPPSMAVPIWSLCLISGQLMHLCAEVEKYLSSSAHT